MTPMPSASWAPTGRGTPAKFGVSDRVDIVTGTLGKALGGASGGYVSARREIVEVLKQRARPYLFSNSVAPAVVGASLDGPRPAGVVGRPAGRAATAMPRASVPGWSPRASTLLPGEHAIVPVMFGDAVVASAVAEQLWQHGVYAVAFSFPVVPQGQARIRVQLSAASHRRRHRPCGGSFVEARDAVGASS